MRTEIVIQGLRCHILNYSGDPVMPFQINSSHVGEGGLYLNIHNQWTPRWRLARLFATEARALEHAQSLHDGSHPMTVLGNELRIKTYHSDVVYGIVKTGLNWQHLDINFRPGAVHLFETFDILRRRWIALNDPETIARQEAERAELLRVYGWED